MMLQIETATFTDAGRKSENVDACGMMMPTDNTLVTKGITAIVADGVESSEGGSEASITSITSFLADYYSTPDDWSVKQSAGKVISAINAWLYHHSLHSQDVMKGMITTFSAVIFKSTTAHLIHVGDSRICRLRKQHLEQLTRDHTTHFGLQRKFLSRALGSDQTVEVDYLREPIEQGDIFILTTDGVHEYISSNMLINIIQGSETLDHAARYIIECCEKNGSPDNLTCVLCRVDDLPVEEQEKAAQKRETLPPLPHLAPEDIVEGYRILEPIHEGSQSRIYLAENEENGRIVVIKTPAFDNEGKRSCRESFRREAWIGESIVHPNIMQVLPHATGGQFLYHVCEYIEGVTLSQWMADNPAPKTDTVASLVQQVAGALRALRRNDITHGNLNPDNIMIDYLGRAKLIDYGKAVNYKSGGKDGQKPAKTGDCLSRATAYTAPESWLMGTAPQRPDIFALGIITYEMLTGKLPFNLPQETSASLLRKGGYRQLRYTPAPSRRPDIPFWMDKALEKATAPDPRNRFSSLSDFCLALSRPPAPRDKMTQNQKTAPLMTSHPVITWQVIAALLLFSNLVSCYLLINNE